MLMEENDFVFKVVLLTYHLLAYAAIIATLMNIFIETNQMLYTT